jgi:hypothetical protein
VSKPKTGFKDLPLDEQRKVFKAFKDSRGRSAESTKEALEFYANEYKGE